MNLTIFELVALMLKLLIAAGIVWIAAVAFVVTAMAIYVIVAILREKPEKKE